MSSWFSGLPLPGEKEAHDLGYSTWAHSGDHKRAWYTKDGIGLEVWYSDNGLEAKLSFIHRSIVVSTFGSHSGFQFPHPDFKHFEDQIITAKLAIEDYDTRGVPF